MNDTTGKSTVLITGGASGIGRSLAESFADAGYAVPICDAAQGNIDTLQRDRPELTATVANVADPDDVDRVFADIRQQHGRLDVLVNNAGVAGPTAKLQDIADEEWQTCLAVDLNGPFYFSKRAVPLLLKSPSASIINIASTAALFGYPLRSPYAAAKWALVGLTKTWAMELGPRQIRVNAICPGSVEGERIDAVIRKDAAGRGLAQEQVRDVYLRQTSMRTFVSANDIAAMALFLASPAAARVSGQGISVDGHTEGLSNWLD